MRHYYYSYYFATKSTFPPSLSDRKRYLHPRILFKKPGQYLAVSIVSKWEEMAEEKESTSIPLSQGENGGEDPEDPAKSPPSSPNSSTRKVCFSLCLFLSQPFKLLTFCWWVNIHFELYGSTGSPVIGELFLLEEKCYWCFKLTWVSSEIVF